MAMRDSDTSLWLHNKLGTSNDSWISGSICSQLNKEVLRNIKECFPDLQTQVKLKLLLSFFHIPRRLVEEWKTELEEIIEVAGLDSELWVSMLSETMKTFPTSGSLNTEISEYEETRPIFTDMVNDLRKMVSKHCDLGMLPLECQYLNKNALISVVGQQQIPVKHFTLKRKPKSAHLRNELLHKSADAQSSLKKASAPTIPLRSRGMPRKMTDTTPLKGIPSRVPTSGFRSPNVAGNLQRPNIVRTPAGRKDGGIKLIELSEQPLGYAAAKKRKREQQLEEQAKKHEQKQNAAAAAAAAAAATVSNDTTSPISSPTRQSVVNNTATTPTTPTTALSNFEIKTEDSPNQANPSINCDDTETTTTNEAALAMKTESVTPDYAPTLTYTQTANATVEKMIEDVKTQTKTLSKNIPTVNKSNESSNITISTQSNNSLIHTTKHIKQEIEIQSEEIKTPSIIKVEKIETSPVQTTNTDIQSQAQMQTVTVQSQQQPHHQTPRTQQRLVIQQRTVPALQQQQPQQIQKQGTTIRQVQSNPSAVPLPGTTIRMEKLNIKPLVRSISNTTTNTTNTGTTILTQQQLKQSLNPLANLPNNISVKITSNKGKHQSQTMSTTTQSLQQQQQQPILINNNTPVILASPPNQQILQKQIIATPTSSTAQTLKNMPLSQLKSATNSGPVIISQTIIQTAKRANTLPTQTHSAQQQQQTQYVITSQPQQQVHQNTSVMSNMSTYSPSRTTQQQTNSFYQSSTATMNPNSQTSTKILLKTSPTSSVVMTPVRTQQQANTLTIGNPPPLIATSSQQQTQQPTSMLSLQNVQLPNRPVTIQPASQAAQQQHLQAQLQQQQQHPHTIVGNTTTTQQPKLTQVLVQQTNATAANSAIAAANVNNNINKNKTIILAQKGVILRNIGGDMYQQIPISNVSGLQTLGTGTTLMTTTAGPPNLVKTTNATTMQPQRLQLQQQQQKNQQMPTLITANTVPPQHVIVQQQPTANVLSSTPQQTIIRPVMANVQGTGLATLPQGITLIQRPGQQPQLVQVQTATAGTGQQPQLQRTIITQPVQQQPQIRTQQIVLQQKPSGGPQTRLITTTNAGVAVSQINQQIHQNNSNTNRHGTHIVQVTQQPHQTMQQSQQQQAAPQRKGLSLSNEHVHKAHEMFRKANRVSRPDKALILGFMAGVRENPRPNFENVLVIKLGESEEKVQQEDGSTALCLVESHIRLDYNTGEWKTFQNYRRLDQTQNIQAQSSVVI